MKKLLAAACLIAFAASCRTIDLEKQTVSDDGVAPLFEKVEDVEEEEQTAEQLAVSELQVNVPQNVVIIEKPVFIPEKDWAAKQKLSGGALAREITEQGIIKPADYRNAAFLYDYAPDQVYQIYAQVLRTTDITLEPDEAALDMPFISDSENWILAAGVNKEDGKAIQHIYVKPKKSGLEATFIINTDRRVYHLLLMSFNTTYMPIVKWRYRMPQQPLIFSAAKGTEEKSFTPAEAAAAATPVSLSEELEYVDPRFLSFNYKVRYSIFKKPRWLPRLVYDDGQKTYIVFEKIILQTELPVILDNVKDIVNYRVSGDLIVIDKLVEKITVTYREDKITVEKKKS